MGGIGKESGKCYLILGENVVVGVGVKVLGNIVIGDNVCIGVGLVVLWDVLVDFMVVGVLGCMVYFFGERVNFLEYGKLLDLEGKVICLLLERIELLE